MKHFKKLISLICAFCLIFGTLSGCGGSQQTEEAVYDPYQEMTNVDSGVVAENSNFTLSWNSEHAVVNITSKKDGTVWSTTPTEFIENGAEGLETSQMISSLLMISSINAEQIVEYYSSACVAEQRFSSEKIDNGIRVTFYFDYIEVIAGIDIYLEDDSFKVKVDPTQIQQFAADSVVSVTPTPFMCATKNTEAGSKDSYFVIPSGSGAIMYTDSRSDGQTRVYSDKIYGSDKSISKFTDDVRQTPINMPFFGMKIGDAALCAIIESGAESSGINCRAGDQASGYSNINVYYNTLGYENIYNTGSYRTQYNSGAETNLDPLVIGYYQLYGDSADYTGVAKRYKKYLVEEMGMEKSQDNSLLTVKLLGGYVEDDLFLGFPTEKDVSITSYEEAEDILTELNTIAGGSLVADMYGYGKGGINGITINGSGKLTGVTGNTKSLKNFLEFTNSSSIKTFFNFDSVTFAKSGSGYSINTDTAHNIIDISATVYQYKYSNATRLKKDSGGVVRTLISRSLLSQSVADSVEIADKYGITGVAYDTLGNYCYSDYNSDDDRANYYPLASKMGSDVSSIIGSVKENSKTVMIDGAFAYAAAAADIITGCPTASQQMLVFDADVPIYQIVFQGTKANSITSINLANNQRQQFLKAIESGSGLSFTLMANYNNELRKQYMRGLNSSLYSDNIDTIEQYVSEAKDFLNSVSGSSITSHAYLTNDVTRTVFENGVSVIVNFGEKNYVSEEYGTVKAESFVTK